MVPEESKKAKKLLRDSIKLVQSDMASIKEIAELEDQLATIGAVSELDDEGKELAEKLKLLFKERKRLLLEIIMGDYA